MRLCLSHFWTCALLAIRAPEVSRKWPQACCSACWLAFGMAGSRKVVGANPLTPLAGFGFRHPEP